MDKETVDGINLWLSARKIEAMHLKNRGMFDAINVLQEDLIRASNGGKYPWEIIVQGYSDAERNRTRKMN
jgi:hypothetical protein